MRRKITQMKKILKVMAVTVLLIAIVPSGILSAQGIKRFGKGYRYDKNGWIYIHIEGKPYERGLQYGYLSALEYKEAIRCYKALTYEITGKTYDFFVKQAVRLHKDKIPQELLEEMRGIADGLTKAGVPATLDDIIGWNAYLEITEYWWPLAKTKYAFAPPAYKNKSKGRCSAFIATGEATKDGKIVIAHETFDDFWSAQFENVILDLVPAKGNRIIMQTSPCYVDSLSDFFISSAGIVGVETTIAGFNQYDENGIPEYVRARMAMQYGNSIDEFIKIMQKGNNGGYANVWLIGDINTNEIAQLEQGLHYTNVQKKKNGYWFGCNAVSDPRIRNLECVGVGYNDVRRQTGGRRARFSCLMPQFMGKLDVTAAKKILSDHYNVYTGKIQPSANTICAHYDNDPRKSMSSPYGVWPDPYSPAGSVDGKITTSSMARQMKMLARFGRACGHAFDAEKFFKEHPQWGWQKGYLKSRPSQPWTVFRAGRNAADYSSKTANTNLSAQTVSR